MSVRLSIKTEETVSLVLAKFQAARVTIVTAALCRLGIYQHQTISFVLPLIQRVKLVMSGVATAALQIISGPQAEPAVDSCEITWTTNQAAYHRVRYRPASGGDWQYTDWTETPSTEAAVILQGLS